MKIYKKISVLFLSVSLILASASGCAQTQYPDIVDMSSFNTISKLVIGRNLRSSMTKKEYDALSEYFAKRLPELHKMYDIYYEYSGINNIKTINMHAGISPVKVSKEIIDLLELSKEIYDMTEGRVNIAYGSVLSVWHTYRNDGKGTSIPSAAELKEAQKHTDISGLVIDRENSEVYLKDKNMSLDVGAVAKGYAAELIHNELSQMGYNGLLIDLGGNIRLLQGTDSNSGHKFNVGITDPADPDKYPPDLRVSLENGSVVSSGDYQRYYIVDGKRYHHIIDPETNMPGQRHRAVGVICENSALADAYSTYLFILSTEEGKKFCEKVGAEAVWFEPDGAIIFTDGFPKM